MLSGGGGRGGGGVEENVPEQSIYFFPVGNKSEKQIFFFVPTKYETIFLVLIIANVQATLQASIIHVHVIQLVVCLVM